MNYPHYSTQKTKKPVHKRAWFWILIGIGALGTIVIVTITAIALLFADTSPAPQPTPEATTSVTTQAPEATQGPDTSDVPREWEAALKAGQRIADRDHSKAYVHRTLTSTVYGFPEDAAQYAVDNITGDWNERALNAAIRMRERDHSNAYIHRTLTSVVYGFTKDEADYAVANLEP